MSNHSHKVTIFLEHPGSSTTVTTETSEPDIVTRQIIDSLDRYYRYRWLRRSKTCLVITGKPTMVIPLEKLLFFKIEPISRDFQH